MLSSDIIQNDPDFSVREQEVLATVLDLIVEEGDGFSMSKVAKRASCSKETLYRWFHDREGLLTATVQWQASKVSLPKIPQETLTISQLRHSLEVFAVNWLTVITSEISIALNRLAISVSATKDAEDRNNLGKIVLHNGPFAMARRLKPVFELATRKGLLRTTDHEEAFRVFFGLVVADTQIRALLGEKNKLSARQIRHYSNNAVETFLSRYGKNPIQSKHNDSERKGE